MSIQGDHLVIDNARISANTLGTVDGARIGIDLRLTGDAVLSSNARISTTTSGNGNAGAVTVEARRVTLTGGSGIGSDAVSLRLIEGAGGTVTIRATEEIVITGRTSAGVASRVFSASNSQRRSAGRIFITAPALTLTDGGVISSSTIQGGPGEDILVEVGRLTLAEGARIFTLTIGTQASTIIIRASEAVFIEGQDRLSGISTINAAPGAPGRIVVQTPTLSLAKRAQIAATTTSDGSGGAVVLEIGRLTLTGGARIDTSAGGDPFGGGVNPNARGSGGTVTVTATEAVFIAGGDVNGLPSGLFSATGGRGAAGRISVTAPTVTLADRAQLSAGTTGEGPGGNVTIAAGRVTVTGGAQITTNAARVGRGGTVVVEAKDTVLLTQGGTISASSTGQGDAGQITIKAGSLFRSRQGLVTAAASIANGGEITLAAPLVALTDSTITTTVPGGRGGNITIGPGVQFLTLNDSQIRAQALREAGGNITLDTTLLASPASIVEASGTLTIGQLVLPQNLLSAPLLPAFAQLPELSRNQCVARLREGRVSRLVVGGRDGVPLEPGSLLLSPLVQTGQEGVVHGEEEASYNSEALYGRARYAQTQAPEGLEVECARWRGQPRPPATPKRRR